MEKSYAKQDLQKFEDGLPTWKEWLSAEEHQGWCDFVAHARASGSQDVPNTNWLLDKLRGIPQESDQPGTTAQHEPRISGRDTTIPRVSIIFYVYTIVMNDLATLTYF